MWHLGTWFSDGLVYYVILKVFSKCFYDSLSKHPGKRISATHSNSFLLETQVRDKFKWTWQCLKCLQNRHKDVSGQPPEKKNQEITKQLLAKLPDELLISSILWPEHAACSKTTQQHTEDDTCSSPLKFKVIMTMWRHYWPLPKVNIYTRTAGNWSPAVKNYKYGRKFSYQTYSKGMAWSAYRPLKKKKNQCTRHIMLPKHV